MSMKHKICSCNDEYFADEDNEFLKYKECDCQEYTLKEFEEILVKRGELKGEDKTI